MSYKSFFIYLVFILTSLFILFLPYIVFENPEIPKSSLRIMTYSSFIQSWGAGPQIEKIFKQETGIDIHWINAGNAGLLIERLKFKQDIDQPDLVIGFDQFSIDEARKNFSWLKMSEPRHEKLVLPQGAHYRDFLAYDWGPMTFIFRDGEMMPPKSLTDLLNPEYHNKIILQDPRMSSPGLQFFFWVLSQMGEEEGLRYLKKLKKSIKVISPSWSSSYSLFKMQKPSLVFSYYTSFFFHQQQENDLSYKAILFDHPHPVQVEYLGIPKDCQNCDKAQRFANFILRKDIQRLLMKKNYMFPVLREAMEGTIFKIPEKMEYFNPIENRSLLKKKKQLVNQWKKVFF